MKSIIASSARMSRSASCFPFIFYERRRKVPSPNITILPELLFGDLDCHLQTRPVLSTSCSHRLIRFVKFVFIGFMRDCQNSIKKEYFSFISWLLMIASATAEERRNNFFGTFPSHCCLVGIVSCWPNVRKNPSANAHGHHFLQ